MRQTSRLINSNSLRTDTIRALIEKRSMDISTNEHCPPSCSQLIGKQLPWSAIGKEWLNSTLAFVRKRMSKCMHSICGAVLVLTQVIGCSLLGPVVDGYSCGNAAARSDLQKITLKELRGGSGWLDSVGPFLSGAWRIVDYAAVCRVVRWS